MASVGGVNFDLMRGIPQLLKQRVDRWEVPGIDGVGAQTLGLGDGDYELVTVAYIDTSSDANTLLNNAIALQGTVVSLVDDWDDTYGNMLVKHVVYLKQPVLRNNAHQVRVEVHWTMEST